MKRIALVTNLESRGLLQDTKILNRVFSQHRHNAFPLQYDKEPAGQYDLAIHCETIAIDYLSAAPRHWYLCNPEFMSGEHIRLVERNFELVLCKTFQSYKICQALFGDRARYTGFISADRWMPGVSARFQVLHIAGKSQVKGTQAVIDAWRWEKNGSRLRIPLIVVASMFEDPEIEGVKFCSELPDSALRSLQNQSLFHLQPSATEGFGHVLHEVLSCDRFLMTTDAPPMNEIISGSKIPSFASRGYGNAKLYAVEATAIFEAVKRATEQDIWGAGREEFNRRRQSVQISMGTLIGGLEKPAIAVHTASPQRGYVRAAFLGNFDAPESTENQIKWALERLGHDVVMIQENGPLDVKQIVRSAAGADLFFWVHTHGWMAGVDMAEVLRQIRETGTKSVSLHLDRYWGIPEREPGIGVDPFWKTDFVFTADGGNQDKFVQRGVPHYWLRPAVSEVYIHPGTWRAKYACDVGFVGAVEYHQCYPFRPQMIRALQHRYGNEFKVVQGVRGHELNDVYASMRVIVGDCIFAGSPRYVSDRLPETTGRHGFLLHPEVEGIDNPVATYKPQDVEDLIEKIDYWLSLKEQRNELIEHCVKYVRMNDTWTIRMAELIFNVYFGGAQGKPLGTKP